MDYSVLKPDEVATAYKNPTIKELQKIMDTAKKVVNKLKEELENI